jgi:hypothetical protein
MVRPVDHLVLPVTTLMLARSRLTSLGFTVAPDARHPFGTGNCCVFFEDRTYLEPITILDRSAADIAAAEGLFFVKRLKRFTERYGEGFAMVALHGVDARAEQRSLAEAGIGSGDVFEFRRAAPLPDGSEGEIGVALAFLENPAVPDATLFVCQHLAADVLFQPAFLTHPNGATGIGRVVAVADDPPSFGAFLAAATGGGESILVVDPAGYRTRYGLEPPGPRRGLLFAAFELRVADLDRALGYSGPTALRHDGRIVVPPAPGLGAALAFMPNADV